MHQFPSHLVAVHFMVSLSVQHQLVLHIKAQLVKVKVCSGNHQLGEKRHILLNHYLYTVCSARTCKCIHNCSISSRGSFHWSPHCTLTVAEPVFTCTATAHGSSDAPVFLCMCVASDSTVGEKERKMECDCLLKRY